MFGDTFLAQGLHLKSHQRCSAGFRTWLSADQSSSSTLTESSFLFDPCLIHRGHYHVRIEKRSCPNCCYKIRSRKFPRISLYAETLRFVLMEITKVVKTFIRRG